MHIWPSSRQARFWTTTLVGGTVLAAGALGLRRVAGDREAARVERDLFTPSSTELKVFSPDLVADLPEPARRYLLHAIAPGTPLTPAARLQMHGEMRPTPGGPQITFSAKETIAPRRGFVWTARTRLYGLPVHVRDHYFDREGGLRVHALGLLPVQSAGGEDVTRSARGRLVAEAVWCPTALAGPGVTWEAAGPDRARFTLAVDGEPVTVTLHVGPEGALREVTLDRWGDVGVPAFRPLPYGFRVEEEATFAGVTIPTFLRGGWWYGTDRFDPGDAATFAIRSATFAGA